MGTEIERRFLVLGMRPDANLGPGENIRQGYLEVPFPEQSLRVRIIDDKKAFITGKRGTGMVREEEELPVALEAARLLMKGCTHFVEKTRHHYRGWVVDFFHAPLSGIVLTEKEMQSTSQKIKLPCWVEKATEVTESISNLHLARLATDLRGTRTHALAAVYERLFKKIPRILLTGGPCSGKSAAMKIIRKELGDAVHCVPEVATIVIAQVGIKPPANDPLANRSFQRTIYRVQRIFETTSAEHAIGQGKKALVLDRGTVDNAAYMAGGLEEMENIYQTTRRFEYLQYDLVIYLGVPAREIYEKEYRKNPARSETYPQAVSRGQKVKEVWGKHPKFCVIEEKKSWKRKREKILSVIRTFLTEKDKGHR